MALNKTALKTALENVFKKSNSPSEAASAIADAIDAFVKTASVSTSVTGTCATPAGSGTIEGAGTGSLS